MIESKDYLRAYIYAMQAHNSIGQVRKYTGEPYHMHPLRVMRIVAESCDNFPIDTRNDMLCAAALHDVLEDVAPANAQYDLPNICMHFSPAVINLVVELTNVYTKASYPDWNRDKRHLAEVERLAKVSNPAKLIKLADILDNTKDLVKYDPNFAKTYLTEKKRLIEYLYGPENSGLYKIVKNQIEEEFNKLENVDD